MNRMACIGAMFACLLAAMAPPRVAAETAAPAAAIQAVDDPRAILRESDRQHRPRAEEYLGDVTVIAKNGKERRKTWRSYREGPPGASDRLIRFLSPPDVRGVGYLARHRPGQSPDEWLYLPSMKRERRIGTRDREAAFVGTNFNYEDLDLLELDDSRYDTSMLPQRTMDGVVAYVIQLVPKTRSIYSKKVLTIRRDNLSLMSAEFFVGTDVMPVKRLTFGDYMSIGGYLVATRLEVVDLKKGGRTVVVLRDVTLDRPQPKDRYTIQNLLREDEGGVPASGNASAPFTRLGARQDQPGGEPVSPRLLGGSLSGYVEGRSYAFFPDGVSRDATAWQWGTAFLRETTTIGRVRVSGAVRFEASSSSQVGSLSFDPADRDPRRSPISLRELAATVPIASGVDLQAGRFQVAWGGTDGYSTADAFLPRDLSDPLTEERLPLWGVRLRGERGGIRFDFLVAPTTTPWRLPDFSGRQSPFAAIGVIPVERPWSVPEEGFEAARIEGSIRGWDVGGWARAGVRPAPVIVPRLDESEQTDAGLVVPFERRYAREQAAGAQIAHDWGGWVVRGEVGVFHSNDRDLGDAVIWAVGGSRLVGDGTFTATVAANASEPAANPLLLFDRALLPVAILAMREAEPWGSWRAAWVATFREVGGILALEATRDLTDVVKITAGADLPHGAALSPADAFSGGKRVRAAVRWSW